MKWRAAIFFIFFFGDITRGKLIPPNIPSNLEECYNDSFILTKDNLLPMTVNTFISIIRKIEDSVSTSMDMRTLTPAIISTFRYDGIVRNPEIAPQPLVIPYAPKGTEFPLFQTLFQQVLPNIGSTIPNETLSYLERCTLHVMLSSSIDVWDRGDNDAPCNYNQKFSWNPRSPRDLSKTRDAEVFDPRGLKPQGKIMNGHRGNYQQSNFGALESACPVENGIVYSKYGDISPGIVLSGIYAGLNPQKSPPRNLYMQPRNLKRKPTQPQQPNYPNYDIRRQNGGYNRAQYDPSGSNNGFGFGSPPSGNPGYPGNNPGYPSNNPGYPSNNPGNYPAAGPNYGYGGLKEVEGKYAATLAGLLANAVILQAPESPQHSINLGGSGHWNSTVAPKYYFLSNYQKFMVTDARLRGGLDGLLMGDSIQSWVNAGRGNLKLSQILSMYYSQKGVFGSDIKACKRKGYLEKFTNDLEDQTYSMAEVLKDAVPSARIPDEYIHEFSYESIQSLRRYIPTLNDIICEYTNSSSPPAADLHVIVDCSWNFREISDILMGIAESLDLRKYGGNMTIVNAKDGTVMVDSAKSVSDLAIQFNVSLYTSKPMGLDIAKALSMIRHRFKDKMDYDKITNSPGGYARIVVFIPSSTTNIPDSDANIAKSILINFKENLPDIKFLYFVTGSASKWNQFADQPSTDVVPYIMYSPLDPLIARISTVPRRIINPTCGRYWSGYWYNELSFNGYLDYGETHFYKISTNYFFRDANAKITISTDAMAPTLTICTSRSNANPLTNNSRSGDVACNQLTSGNRFSFEIPKEICSEVYYVSQCNPYYISITSNQQNTQLVSTCTDRECRDPDMIKYTISHIGLSCYSGVSKLFSSSYLLIFIIVVHFSNLKTFI